MTSILHAGAVAVLALGTGAAAVTTMNRDIPDLAVPEGPWEAGQALDGRVFYTIDRIEGMDEVLTDELHFRDGLFQSAMCQDYCDFGWTPYQTWMDGETIRFTVTTSCPDAPHTVVWYGMVTGDEVRFEGTWTTRRWYWTRQLRAEGAGDTTPHAEAPAG